MNRKIGKAEQKVTGDIAAGKCKMEKLNNIDMLCREYRRLIKTFEDINDNGAYDAVIGNLYEALDKCRAHTISDLKTARQVDDRRSNT